MNEKRIVIYEGWEGSGDPSMEEQAEKLGIDIKSGEYDFEWDGAEGYDDGVYTPFRIVRVIPSMSIEWPQQKRKIQKSKEVPEEQEEEEVEKPPREQDKQQDMLDKYYGNKEKEKQYIIRMRRFKSHIVDREFEYENQDGEKVKTTYKTVEEYPEKAKDEKFLKLEDYAYKLERLSRAEAGDISLYEIQAKKFEEIKRMKIEAEIAELADNDVIGKANLQKKLQEMEKNYGKNIADSIAKLQLADSQYLSTNNFAYNQHEATQSNLPTLGRHGENVPYLRMSKGKDIKSIFLNIGKGIANIWLAGRNYIAAPIDRVVGTYVVAPIHRILYDSEKNVEGVYKGFITHRYTARKDYFTYKYFKELEKINKDREAKGLPPKKPSVLKLAFGIPFQAMRDYKEGNIAVLATKAQEREEDIQRKENEERHKQQIRSQLEKEKEKLLQKMAKCKKWLEIAYTQEEKLALEVALQEGAANLLKIDRKIEENEMWHIDSVVQTDAITREQHKQANKDNVTRVVTGIKNAAMLATAVLVSRNLSKEVAEKITEEQVVPEQTIVTQQWVPEKIVTIEKMVQGKIDLESLSKITVNDLAKATQNGTVSYTSAGGNVVLVPDKIYFRGIAIENLNGSSGLISGSDGIGFSIAGRTDVQISQMTEATKLFDVISETMNALGKSTTPQELMLQIVNSPNPQETLIELLKGTRIWISSAESGIPTGWLNISDIAEKFSQGIQVPHMETVTNVTPGYWEEITKVIPGTIKVVESTRMKKVINGRAVAIEALLAAGSLRDLYELARQSKGNGKDRYVDPNTNNPYGFSGNREGDYASTYQDGEER